MTTTKEERPPEPTTLITTAALLPQDLQARLDAASTAEEVRQVIMSMIAAGEIAVNMPAVDKRTEAIYELRQKVAKERGIAEGTRIGVSDAAKKYDASAETIRRWANQTLKDGNPVVLIYEKGFGRGKQIIVDENHVIAMIGFTRSFRTNGQKGGPVPGFYKYPSRKKTA